MQVIQNQTASGTTIAVDDKHFINCRFKDCTLIYSGGDFALASTAIENCQIQFTGAASRTMSFLSNFGIIGPAIESLTPSSQSSTPTPSRMQ